MGIAVVVTLAFISNGSVMSDYKDVGLSRLATCNEDVGRIVFRDFKHGHPSLMLDGSIFRTEKVNFSLP